MRGRPDDAEALHALAVQLVLWAGGRRGGLIRADRVLRRALTLAPDRAEFPALAGRIHDDSPVLRPEPEAQNLLGLPSGVELDGK